MFYPDQYLHIEVLFLGMSPERLLEQIKLFMENRTAVPHKPYSGITEKVSDELYCHCARSLPANWLRTEDELLQRYRDLKQYLDRHPQGGILHLLADYARDVLDYKNAEPQIRLDHILDWRERTLHLGQDLFTCAGLAWDDIDCRRTSTYFSWPAAVSCDHIVLRRMLSRGMSENHAHLNGSTQIFPLTWSFLMNHPKSIRPYFNSAEMSQRNLSSTVSFGVKDNQNDWTDMIYLAAWLRAFLFRAVLDPEWRSTEETSQGSPFWQLFSFWHSSTKLQKLCREVEVRRIYGERFSFSTARKSCLDYAILPYVARDNSNANRLLVGERFFLYRCFCQCFNSDRSSKDGQELATLFYLYLLIKIKFRRELVQVNGRKGFRNFSDYQDRKSVVWGNCNDYYEESVRLFITGILESKEEKKEQIRSLEARIAPKKTAGKLYSDIRQIDDITGDTQKKKTGKDSPWPYLRPQRQQKLDEERYFFVLHFIKKPLDPVDKLKHKGTPTPRNAETRKNVEIQAKAIAHALATNSYLCGRIRGIDAASHEIGCRPETFATAFRYLRNFSPQNFYSPSPITTTRYWPRLNATYHAGEDFLDLADGMRAIDEAVCFLDLRRGDRLGHALALGTQPQQYYRVKENYLYLPRQDLLDDIVWLLFRSLEWGVSISSSMRHRLQLQGERLLHQIYGGYLRDDSEAHLEFDLADYYQSWKLRGDDPSLYLNRSKEGTEERIRNALRRYTLSRRSQDYERERLDRWLWDHEPQETVSPAGLSRSLSLDCDNPEETGDSEDVLGIRIALKTRLLLHAYHYDLSTRKRGQQIDRFSVNPEYIQLIHDMQEAMMEQIMSKGIAIECNPSSNKLIGTFDKYEQHPIFRFNSYNLALPDHPHPRVQLPVSVNTDDLGVFDTSLENEYALLYGCLRQRTDSNGSPLLTDDAILAYLDHLRMMGNDMIFPKAEKGIRRKR